MAFYLLRLIAIVFDFIKKIHSKLIRYYSLSKSLENIKKHNQSMIRLKDCVAHCHLLVNKSAWKSNPCYTYK